MPCLTQWHMVCPSLYTTCDLIVWYINQSLTIWPAVYLTVSYCTSHCCNIVQVLRQNAVCDLKWCNISSISTRVCCRSTGQGSPWCITCTAGYHRRMQRVSFSHQRQWAGTEVTAASEEGWLAAVLAEVWGMLLILNDFATVTCCAVTPLCHCNVSVNAENCAENHDQLLSGCAMLLCAWCHCCKWVVLVVMQHLSAYELHSLTLTQILTAERWTHPAQAGLQSCSTLQPQTVRKSKL